MATGRTFSGRIFGCKRDGGDAWSAELIDAVRIGSHSIAFDTDDGFTVRLKRQGRSADFVGQIKSDGEHCGHFEATEYRHARRATRFVLAGRWFAEHEPMIVCAEFWLEEEG